MSLLVQFILESELHSRTDIVIEKDKNREFPLSPCGICWISRPGPPVLPSDGFGGTPAAKSNGGETRETIKIYRYTFLRKYHMHMCRTLILSVGFAKPIDDRANPVILLFSERSITR